MLRRTTYKLISITLCLVSFITSYSQDSNSADLPHLKENQITLISSKQEKLVRRGCLVTHTILGESELDKILSDSTFSFKTEDKIELFIAILGNENLYHLHDRAGTELKGLTKANDISELLSFLNHDKGNYTFLRINHPLSKVLYSGGTLES